MTEPDRPSNLLRELTRRRIFRSAGAYIVFAWVAIQVASIVFPEFGAPDWSMRALIVLFVVGFPPAMLVAWTVDISSSGVSVTPDSSYSRSAGYWPKVAMVLVSTAFSALALWWLWDDYIEPPSRGPVDVAIRERPIIAVEPPLMRVGADENAWLGNGVATILRSELAESRHAGVVSRSRWEELSAAMAGGEVTLTDAQDIGVDYLVTGEFYETSGSIALMLIVEDVESGMVLASPRFEGGSVGDVLAGVTQLAIDVKSALNIPHQERIGLFEADFAARNIAAYESYVAGLDFLIDFEYAAAERALETALDLEEDFHIARFRLAQVFEASGRSQLAIDTLNEIPADAELSERFRLYVNGARAYFVANRDPARAVEVYRRLVEAYPFELEAGTLLAEAYWLDFRDEAALAELRRLTDIHGYDPAAWMGLAEHLLASGELTEAREALDRYVGMRPEDAYAHAMLGDLAMQEGRYDEAIGHHENSLRLKDGFADARLGLARSHYLGGDIEGALGHWRGLADDESVAGASRIDAVFDLAGVLAGLGRFDEAERSIESTLPIIREEALRLPMALMAQSGARFERGDVESAEVLLGEAFRVADQDSPPSYLLFARGTMALRQDRPDAVRDVLSIMRSIVAEEEDAGTRGAADYLAGKAELADGDIESALPLIESALTADGYEYALYELGLAEALRALGERESAIRAAERASAQRSAGAPRFDLELDRSRALLLHAELLAESGRTREAAELARQFIARWGAANPDRPELARAQGLIG